MAEKTSKTTWFVLGLCVLIGAIIATTKDDVVSDTQTCPPISSGSLWLPETHAQYMPQFQRVANQLNSSGRCVIEGSWGIQLQKFYLAVKPPNAPASKAEHVRYTLDELKQY